uniref:Potassium calcium-activated channel subfamily M regulatory beta subunit 4 n=2 Tax=Dromaius novaehollandiae TaxID=8790 RepID=A0A8C4PAR9_DRONO
FSLLLFLLTLSKRHLNSTLSGGDFLRSFPENQKRSGSPPAPPEGKNPQDQEQCSYIPPCARDDQENSENVTYKQKYWKEKVGSQPFTCYFNQHLRPDDVMLKRTHDETVLLHCFLWPLVTFLVGVLIVVLTICAKSLAVKAEAIKKRKHA